MDFSQMSSEDLRNANNTDKWKQALFNSVGFISYKNVNDSISSGTGTLIYKPYNDEGAKAYLITNKHVLPTPEASSAVTFSIHAPWLDGQGKFLNIDVPLYDDMGEPYNHVKFNSNGMDIAVIDFTEPFINLDLDKLIDDLPPFEIIATDEVLKERNLTIGDDVFYIGYPSFFFNSKNATPLLRKGTIATDPKEIYYFNEFLQQAFMIDKLDGFLIDSHAFGGSSGSLVISKPELTQMYNGQIVPSLQKAVPYIIGILTHSYSSLNGSDKFQKLGLGGVINSKYIIETINQFDN